MLVLDEADRMLLFLDSDLGLDPVLHWWVTPGGGVDPGESDLEAGVRELQEETGLVVDAGDLVGPLLTRVVVHGYSDKVVDQVEVFYVVRVAVLRGRHGRAHRGGAAHRRRHPLVDARRPRDHDR